MFNKNIVKQQINILVFISLLVLTGASIAEPGDINKIMLETGEELRVEEIKPSRILPHAYYDQAVSSIPGVYPGSQIIAKQRFFQLGHGEAATFNSIVCYKKLATESSVTITGVSTFNNTAWRFEAETDETRFPDTLIMTLEAISRLPSH